MEDVVNIWRGRRVFLTGHTGFKGGWLALWLTCKGAVVRGYSLDPAGPLNFFSETKLGEYLEDHRGDVRDAVRLDASMRSFAPEVVFHLAAQPLVRAGYTNPSETFGTNVMGTAHLLDAVRRTPSVRALVNVTTDKCYENKEWLWGYRETDALGGHDPYAASKAAAELVTAAYRQSYFAASGAGFPCAVATARAGNVIGGGDWAADRLVPDLVRGFSAQQTVKIRQPRAIRPWQHVLDPLQGYLQLAEKLLTQDPQYATAFNFGPAVEDARSVSYVVERMAALWRDQARFQIDDGPGVHETASLKLDASRARAVLGWRPRLALEDALDWTVAWYKAQRRAQRSLLEFSMKQIERYEALATDDSNKP